ncbi:MAG TPA: Yip1 family protein [Candidatus Gracilibacteria bacterium]|nr:Yip1 family protein [Candidatus Gracilibacteria bacterium]
MEEHKSHESHETHPASHESHHEGHEGHTGSHHAASGNPLSGPEMKMPKMDMKDLNVGGAFQKFLGLLKLDKKVIEEVANDEKGGVSAALFLLVGVVAGPLVGWLVGVRVLGVTVRVDLGVMLGQVVFALVISVLTIFITTLVANKLFKGHGTFAQYFRVMGLANGLGVVNVVGSLMFSLAMIAGLVAGLWMLAIGFTAIKAVFKLDDTNAVLTIIVTVVAYVVLGAVVSALGFAGATAGLSSSSLSGVSLTY